MAVVGPAGRKAPGAQALSPFLLSPFPPEDLQPAPLFPHSACTVGVHSGLSAGLPWGIEGMLLPDHYLPQALSLSWPQL